ncbi:IclR family transcriptional regulator [Variovorax sp. KK3]|uniref:IclR family transcriptional regulator n=1 Tax=Variovorax sp. KK3 TaxID=1855728 RepID=UPI00097C61F4|nr:IclR family transcriptional regulator [Variovorax sp. KK3]
MAASPDSEAATAGAQSVRRALAVLRVLATGQERGVRLTDVVSHTGLNRPTVHRILRVLVEEGAVEQDPATRRYLVGGEVSLLGLARSTRFPIRAIAEPHLRHLSEILGDTAFLTIRNGADSVCIDRRPGSFPVKVLSIEIGARRPLGVGVSGLVLLAAMPVDEMEDVVRRNARKLRAQNIDPADLLQRALQTREQGYAYAPVGVVQGSRAVAVPVCVADGRTVAGLAIATITERLPDDRVPVVVAHMRERAAMIGAQAAELARRSQLSKAR